MHWTAEFHLGFKLDVTGPPPVMCIVRRRHSIAGFIQTNRKKQVKTLTQLAAALVALAGLVGCTTTPPPNASAGTGVVLSPQDEAAVRATLAEFANTWNHHDMKGFHELFTEDVYRIGVQGNIWRGKQRVCEAHDYGNRTFDAKTPWRIENIEVRSLAPQAAVAVAVMNTDWRSSFIMAKRGGAWKIAHFHHSTLLPDILKHDPVWGEKGFRPEKKEVR